MGAVQGQSPQFPRELQEIIQKSSTNTTITPAVKRVLESESVQNQFIAWAGLHVEVVKHNPFLDKVFKEVQRQKAGEEGASSLWNCVSKVKRVWTGGMFASVFQYDLNDWIKLAEYDKTLGFMELYNRTFNLHFNDYFLTEFGKDTIMPVLTAYAEAGLVSSVHKVQLFTHMLRGSDVNDYFEEMKCLLDVQDSDGETSLHDPKTLAALMPTLERLPFAKLKQLLAIQNKQGCTPLSNPNTLKILKPLLMRLPIKQLTQVCAIKNGDGQSSLLRVSTFFHTQDIFCAVDITKAIVMLKKIVKGGNHIAMLLLGRDMGCKPPVTQEVRLEVTQLYEKAATAEGHFELLLWMFKSFKDSDIGLTAELAVANCYAKGVYENVAVAPNEEPQTITRVRPDAGKALPLYCDIIKRGDVSFIDLVKRQSEAGGAVASLAIADAYYKGINCEKDPIKAVEFAGKAVEQGLIKMLPHISVKNLPPIMMLVLGPAYAMGAGVKANDKEAFKWYQAAIKQGEFEAVRRIAAKGEKLACYQVAQCYDKGEGVAKDEEQAFIWYQKAADLGYTPALTQLAICYAEGAGVEPDEQNEQKAFTLCQGAAEKQDPYAQYVLSQFYLTGVGVKADADKSLECLEEAVEMGYEEAIPELAARFFQKGVENAADENVAITYLQKAIDLGDAPAKEMLGARYYEKGKATLDDMTAIEYLQKALILGSAKAALELANRYEAGRGVIQDLVKAGELKLKAPVLARIEELNKSDINTVKWDATHYAREVVGTNIPKADTAIDIKDLKDFFIQANLTGEIDDDGVLKSVGACQKQFNQYIDLLATDVPFVDKYGKVATSELKEAGVNRLRHLVSFLRRNKDPKALKDIMVRLAVCFFHCTDRFDTETLDLYYDYVEPDINNLSLAARTLENQLLRFLQGVRVGALQTIGSALGGAHPAATHRYMAATYGKEFGVPYSDTESEWGVVWAAKGAENKEAIRAKLASLYNPKEIKRDLYVVINDPVSKDKKYFNYKILTEWFKDHHIEEHEFFDYDAYQMPTGFNQGALLFFLQEMKVV